MRSSSSSDPRPSTGHRGSAWTSRGASPAGSRKTIRRSRIRQPDGTGHSRESADSCDAGRPAHWNDGLYRIGREFGSPGLPLEIGYPFSEDPTGDLKDDHEPGARAAPPGGFDPRWRDAGDGGSLDRLSREMVGSDRRY